MKGFIDPNLPDNDITIKIQKALNFADDENIVLASIFQEAKRISLCNLIKLASSTSKKVNALVESSHFDDLTDIDSPKSELAVPCFA